MDELNQKLEIESQSFPILISKHLAEINNNEDSELLYFKQAHEIYMYTFFKNLKLDCISSINIGNIQGHTISHVNLQSFSLLNAVSEKEYFDKLLYAPYPFIFIPNGEFVQFKNFCNGAFSFKGRTHEGVLMDLNFACKVGIDFLACEFLQREEIAFVFIGIVFKSEQVAQC